MNEMYINIGEFNILINLGKDSTDPTIAYNKNKTEIDLLIYLRSFISYKKPTKIDFEIEFLDSKDPELLNMVDNQITYIPLFKTISDRKIITFYQLGIYNFEIVLKNAMFYILKKNGGFGIHASASNIKQKAYLFLAESGGGKSTTAELLKDKFPTLNDDITLIRKLGTKYYLFQTPFVEKPWWIKKTTKLYPVGKIFFLHKSSEFKAILKSNILNLKPEVLPQIIAAQNPDKIIFKNVNDFIKSTNNFYDLYFAKESNGLIKLISQIK
jgi:hypothetical protein